MSLINFIWPSTRVNKYEVAFGTHISAEAPHGAIKAVWIKEGYKNPITISFRIKGHDVPPKMTPELLTEIFHHARMAGIDPECLTSYYDIHNPRPAAKPVSPHLPHKRGQVVAMRSHAHY